MSIKEQIGKKILIFDSAMGTAMQKAGLGTAKNPEIYNFTDADVIKHIHEANILAGSDIITTNTFSANSRKLKGADFTVSEAVSSAVSIIKDAIESTKAAYIAHGIGPSGSLMTPTGDMEFEEAYELYKEQIVAGKEAGVDLYLFETFSDITELRAGILAAKENSDLPVFASMTFGEDGRMLLGTDPVTAVLMIQDMGIDAIGVNCSLGPDAINPIVNQMLEISKLPVFVQPNAGLPQVDGDNVYYDMEAKAFADEILKMAEAGVAAVGGCCGTETTFISEIVTALGDREQKKRYPGLNPSWYEEKINKSNPSSCSVTTHATIDDRVTIIGERLNPTGKPMLQEALKTSNLSFIRDDATEQLKTGADIININVGIPEIDEKMMMKTIVDDLSVSLDCPLQIDSNKPEVIENALRQFRGKPIINSVNGEQASMDKIFPLVKKYGTAVIALTLDENGLPESVADRLRILDKIIDEAIKYNIGRDRIIVDTLALTVSSNQRAAMDTLNAIRKIKKDYLMRTTLGASNISFGLPGRKQVNSSFLSMAIYAGLDAPITDSTVAEYVEAIKSAEVLTFKDKAALDFICYNKEKLEQSNGKNDKDKVKGNNKSGSKDRSFKNEKTLRDVILAGDLDNTKDTVLQALEENKPFQVIENIIIPTLEEIGNDYESGNIFLPQMIKSADVVKEAVRIINENSDKEDRPESAGKLVIATVEGDIHDIGKNIVKSMLENYGFEIFDLGKDVPGKEIVETALNEDIKFVGLSALMTTTVINMEKTIKMLREANPHIKVAVGGAVLTEKYAKKIDADFYCENAMDTVRAAQKVLGK